MDRVDKWAVRTVGAWGCAGVKEVGLRTLVPRSQTEKAGQGLTSKDENAVEFGVFLVTFETELSQNGRDTSQNVAKNVPNIIDMFYELLFEKTGT